MEAQCRAAQLESDLLRRAGRRWRPSVGQRSWRATCFDGRGEAVRPSVGQRSWRATCFDGRGRRWRPSVGQRSWRATCFDGRGRRWRPSVGQRSWRATYDRRPRCRPGGQQSWRAIYGRRRRRPGKHRSGKTFGKALPSMCEAPGPSVSLPAPAFHCGQSTKTVQRRKRRERAKAKRRRDKRVANGALCRPRACLGRNTAKAVFWSTSICR